MRNPCKECDYYHLENNTCQSKKVATMGSGYVTFMDRLFCEPYKADGKKVESDGCKRNSGSHANADRRD